jgi:hypothetical protein
LAALSAGALGPALNLDPEDTWRRWEELHGIMGAAGAPERLERAWQWVKSAAGEEDPRPALTLLRLWWRETARLAAAGPDRAEGPPPDPAQVLWAGRLGPAALERLGRARYRVEDGLDRSVKFELACENFWLSALAG